MAKKLYEEASISDIADAIRSKGGSGTYTVSDMAQAISDLPVGGGAAISLLDTITVPANTRAVNIDMTPYTSYDIVLIFFDPLNVPDNDWVYTARNGTSPSGGLYTAQQRVFEGLHIVIAELAGSISVGVTKREIIENASGVQAYSPNDPTLTNYYLYTYNANKYIEAGSVIKIYGGNYTDL